MWDLIVSVPDLCISFYFPDVMCIESIRVCTSMTYEPPRDKTNKVNVRPAKTQISLGIRPV